MDELKPEFREEIQRLLTSFAESDYAVREAEHDAHAPVDYACGHLQALIDGVVREWRISRSRTKSEADPARS